MKIAIIYNNQLLAEQIAALLNEYHPILLSKEDADVYKTVSTTLYIIVDETQVIIENRIADFSHTYLIPFNEEDLLADVHEQKILCDMITNLSTQYEILSSQVSQKTLLEQHTQDALSNAKSIQKNLMPISLYQDAVFDIYASVEPAEVLAGDFYYYQKLSEHILFFAIGDVSNKNIDAAMYMTKLITGLKSLMDEYESKEGFVSQISNELNVIAKQDNESFQYCTMFLGLINQETKRMYYINAGHEAPYLITPNKNRKTHIKKLEDGEYYAPLGVYEKEYEEKQYNLPKSYKLYLYTDGVTDAANALAGEKHLKRYSHQNLENSLLRCKYDFTSQEICSLIETDIKSFKRGAIQNDDITQICIGGIEK